MRPISQLRARIESLPIGQEPDTGFSAAGRFKLFKFLTNIARQTLDVLNHYAEQRRVILLSGFQLVDLTGKVLVRRQEFAELDEGSHNEDIHLYGARS
jgi:hypothetical protein